MSPWFPFLFAIKALRTRRALGKIYHGATEEHEETQSITSFSVNLSDLDASVVPFSFTTELLRKIYHGATETKEYRELRIFSVNLSGLSALVVPFSFATENVQP